MNRKYFVDADKGIVVATLEDCTKVSDEIKKKCSKKVALALSHMIDMFQNNQIGNIAFDIDDDKIFKAISKCDNDDDFNLVSGKDIAGSKADMKYHEYVAKQYDKLAELLFQATNEVCALRDHHLKKVRNIKNDIERCYM